MSAYALDISYQKWLRILRTFNGVTRIVRLEKLIKNAVYK